MSKTILVVEDDADNRLALCAMLQGLGHTPLSFGSAREALDGLKGVQFAVALLDVMMPEMNGFELMKELKAMPEYKDVPIIMVTARDDDSDVLQGYQHGADYYITKPYTTEQLRYGLELYLSTKAEEL
jgi:CheY-like chemotaxis protein